MRQHPDPYEDEDDSDTFGTPVYQGSGLSVRARTAEELQRFLAAHADRPAELLGSGWAALDPSRHPLWGPPDPSGPNPASGTGRAGRRQLG
jgi:hypothetical protein